MRSSCYNIRLIVGVRGSRRSGLAEVEAATQLQILVAETDAPVDWDLDLCKSFLFYSVDYHTDDSRAPACSTKSSRSSRKTVIDTCACGYFMPVEFRQPFSNIFKHVFSLCGLRLRWLFLCCLRRLAPPLSALSLFSGLLSLLYHLFLPLSSCRALGCWVPHNLRRL